MESLFNFSCFSFYFCSFFFAAFSLALFNCFRGDQVYWIVLSLIGMLTFSSLPDLLKIMIILILLMRSYP
jgi:hypothetical protein